MADNVQVSLRLSVGFTQLTVGASRRWIRGFWSGRQRIALAPAQESELT
jgi:hypothetical protein